MTIDFKFIIILLFVLVLGISAVSASDDNNTDICQLTNDTVDIENTVRNTSISDNATGGNQTNETGDVVKTTPEITLSTKKPKSKDTLEIYLKNSSGVPLKSKIIVTLNKKTYNLKTNSKGVANLPINLAAKSYKLTISYGGDDKYNPVTKTFTIKVSKLKTKITESANFVVRGNYLYFHMVDSRGDAVKTKKVKIKYNGKTYTKKTNSKGKVKIKLKSSQKVKVTYKGDKQYKAISKKVKVNVVSSRSITIGNSKLLTKGFLRVYLKVNGKAISKKVIITVGSKKISKKANSEGIVVVKPKVKANAYTVKAKVGKYYSAKNIKCYDGDVKDPLKDNITYKNGKPDVDVMPGNYVMGDDNAKYTLKKSQYREVLKRDSYCIFLNSKLTKYTFFKTKSHPKLNHIIKREKWNVIERAINEKLVKKNKNGYWPGKITVSLKGKSYKYPYVRDAQVNGRTCGPTSCSMCSQVLRNYVCESYLAKLAHTQSWGTSCPNMIKALKKNNMVATYFYKSTFSKALKEVKNGGAALVFHAKNHYVSILDVSKNSKKVLVSNSYGSYGNIPTKWIKVSYMKKKFSPKWDESLLVKLNYKLSSSTINSINCYYKSMGKNWVAQNSNARIGGM